MNATFRILAILLVLNSFVGANAQIDTIPPPRVEIQDAVVASIAPIDGVQERRSVQTIHSHEIAKLPVNSPDELLRYLSGITVLSRGPSGVQADITARGSSFNQVLIILDGVRLNDPLTGHFSGYFPIPLSEIHSIRVINGASSGIYGTEAVGTVIEIFSKAHQASIYKLTEFKGELNTGSNDYLGGDLYYSRQNARNFWSVAGTRRQADGHYVEAYDENYDFTLQTYSAAYRRTTEKGWQFGARGSFDQREFNARYFYTRSSFDESRENVERYQGNVFLRGSIRNKWRLNLNGGMMQTRDQFVFNPLFTANEHTTSLMDWNLSLSAETFQGFKHTFGAQYLGRSVISNDRGDHQFAQYGVFGLQQLRAGRWNWELSGRLEHHDAFGWEIVPQTSLSYILDHRNQIRLRGFAGKAIRAADVTELYVSNNLPAPLSSGRNLGNPALGPERSMNYELGINWKRYEWFNVDITVFLRDSENLIDFVFTPASEISNVSNLDPEGSYFFARNISKLQTSGIELSLSGRGQLANQTTLQYRIGAMYTMIDDSLASKYIAGSNGWNVNGTLLFNMNKFSWSFAGLYREREGEAGTDVFSGLSTAYATFDTQISYQFRNYLIPQIKVQNIFDRKYADIFGAEMPGRWIMAGFRFNIHKMPVREMYIMPAW